MICIGIDVSICISSIGICPMIIISRVSIGISITITISISILFGLVLVLVLSPCMNVILDHCLLFCLINAPAYLIICTCESLILF